MRIGLTLVLLALGAAPVLRAEDGTTATPPGANTPAQPTSATLPPGNGNGAATGAPNRRAQLPKDQRSLARAITALNQVLKDLNNAPDDFGGNKADAVTACEKARDDLKAALEYRKEHPVDPAPADNAGGNGNGANTNAQGTAPAAGNKQP